MKTLKFFIVFFLGLSAFNSTHAQQLIQIRRHINGTTYNNPTNFPPTGVADDFGPRKLNDNWHGGIDYNANPNDGDGDKGDLVLAPRSGTIVDLNRLIGLGTNGAKYITLDVGDYRYSFVHLFFNDPNNLSAWEFSEMEGGASILVKRMYGAQNNNKWAMIITWNNTTTIIGQVEGQVEYNGELLEVTINVPEGSPIGPLGNSGVGPGAAHLHLTTAPDNEATLNDGYNRNPLQYVNYEEPGYNIQLFSNPSPGTFNVNYPGTNPSPLCVRPEMSPVSTPNGNIHNRYSKIYDLNIVRLLIKKSYESDYVTISGDEHSNVISLGGRLGPIPLIETELFNNSLAQYAADQWGSWTQMGVKSFAYNASIVTRPYDEFYFPDFITRIHKDDLTNETSPTKLSHCPMSTRYNDGRYQIKARVTNIRNANTDSPANNLTIDNYKPFIRSVKVQANGNTFYHRKWDCDDGCQGMKLTPLPTVPNIPKRDVLNGLYVTIEASEPLQTCTLKVNDLGEITQTWQLEDGRLRQFLISPSQVNTLLSAQSIALKFTGTDWSNNALLALNSSHAGSSCVEIPKRTGDNSWEDNIINSGTDVVHFFNPGCGAPRDGEPTLTIIPDESCFNYGTGITWEVTQPSNHSATNGAIVLNVTGGVEPYRYEWSNGGTTDKAEGLAPGKYCVTVYDALCCEQEVCIELCPKITLPNPIAGGPSTCNGTNGQIYFFSGGPSGGTYPYTYLWNTGQTTLSIFYIPSGTYSLTVTDANGCRAEASYTLLAAGEPMVNLESAPPCPGMNNGLLIASATPPGQTGGPYNFVWSSGLIEFNNYLSELNNVGPGNYCVTITDATNGEACPVVRCVQLAALVPDGSLTLKKEDVVNSCAESASGSITLNISGGITPQPGGVYAYTIQWANGLGSSATLNNLAPGTYCYTVTDYCGATASNCVEVLEQENTAFYLELLAIQHVSEPNLNDGLISVAATVAGEYSFQWSNGATGPIINSLATGSHQVTVTNMTTGCSIIRSFVIEDCFEVPNFDARLIGDLVGAAPATFYVQVSEAGGAFSGNIPPGFSIVWETHQDGVIGHGATVTLPANFSGNWIQATVSNGCSEKVLGKPILRCPAASPDSNNPLSFFVTGRKQPCLGFSDGSITLVIPKPGNGGAVAVVMDGNFEIPVSGGDDDFYYVEIGNLAGNIEFKFKITIGDCDYEFPVWLGQRSFEKQFDRIEGDICFYDQACDGHTFTGDEQFQEPIQFDWPNTTGSLASGTCKTPLLCGSKHTGQVRKFGQTYTSTVGYMNTLAHAELSDVYPLEYIHHLQSSVEEMGECRLIRYCRGSLKFLGHSPMNPLVSSQGTIFSDPSTGCQFVDCAFPIPSYVVCPHHADVFGGISPEIANCFPRRKNVFELLIQRPSIVAQFPNTFPGSELDIFLQDHAQDQEAKCAYVIYCQNNFSFIDSNIDEIICGLPLYVRGLYVGNTCNAALSPSGAYRIFCDSGISILGLSQVEIKYIKNNQYVFAPTENLNEELFFKSILDPYDQEQLLDFGIAQLGDIVNPKGLINTAQGYVMDDFDPVGNQVLKHKADTVVTHYVSDWEKQITCYVEALQPDTAYQLIYEDTSDFWIKPITTSPGGLVQIRHLSVSPGSTEVMLVGGVFNGDLVYNAQVLASATQPSGFLLSVRLEDGGAGNVNTFKGLSELVFSENRKGTVVLAGKRSGNILVNNQTWTMPSGAGVTAIRIDEQNQVALVDNLELTSGAFNLKDVAITESGYDPGAPVSIALWGAGTILAGNQMLTYPAGHLVILTVTQPGTPATVATTPAANLDQDHFDMAFDKAGESLMAGFTIQNTVTIFGETFQSAGGQDIVLALFRIDGQLSRIKQYGGVENENVSKVLQNHNVLYFGGEFDGSVGDKTIGRYVFSNLVAATTRAYISFLTFEESGGVVALSGGEAGEIPAAQVTTQSTMDGQQEAKIAVFPNPFNNKVRIHAFGENISAIQVVNALGQPVYDFRGQAFSDFEIDFGENANGIYFLKFYDHSGALVETKSIVKMN